MSNSSVAASAGLCALMLLFVSCAKPPTERMKRATDLRTNCILIEAERWASPEYRQAAKLYADAERELLTQQQKWKLLRNYGGADSLFALAADSFIKTTARVQDSLAALEAETDLQLSFLERELTAWRSHLDTSLVIQRLEVCWSQAEANHESAVALRRERDYIEALSQIAASRSALDDLLESVTSYQRHEAADESRWQEWISGTIKESAIKQRYAVIVEKAAHQAHLIRNGAIVRSFKCDLGFRPARQKLFSGDGATPEGRYKVKSINNSSKYYRALVLDYPNKDDHERYRDNKAGGIIPNGRGIGSLIEVHGHGGLGRDWTDGCVALPDADLDSLMQFAVEGTPVTIVRRWPESIAK